jgi:hypothetical protein
MTGMTAAYQSWPAPARTMARAVDAAVEAAGGGELDAFTVATADLVRLDRGQLIVLLGAVVRELLEQAHPDGLDSEDAEQVLESCLRSAAWYPALERDALIRALTGALGVGQAEEDTAADEPAVLTHGLLLIADQVATLDRRLPPLLDAALRELMREQTVELP